MTQTGLLQTIQTLKKHQKHKASLNKLAVKRKKKSEIFPADPDNPTAPRRGNPKQILAFPRYWGHKHNWSIDYYVGSTRSGKSVGSMAFTLWACERFPGIRVLIGSTDFEHLKTSVIRDYREMLSSDPINAAWDDPRIQRGVSQNHKSIIWKNGSIIDFRNLIKFTKILGSKYDILVVDEFQNLPSGEFLDTILTRLSNTTVPWKKVIFTGNPLEEIPEWVNERCHLDEFDAEFQGERKCVEISPDVYKFGKACDCQYCMRCKRKDKQKIERIEGKCPKCNYINKSKCPGQQIYQRLIFCRPEDNDFVGDSYDSNLSTTMSADKYERLGKGQVITKKKGKCYPGMSMQNVLSVNKPLDKHRDLVWCLDNNADPHCSVVCQEYEANHPIDGSDVTEILIQNEFYEPNSTVEILGRKFIERYKSVGLTGSVRLYPDPNMWNEANQLVSILNKAGFKAKNCGRKTTYRRRLRIESVDYMLKDGSGYRRIKFNPQAKYTIKSISGTEWDDSGTKENENPDRRAKRSGKPNELHQMTHHGCAFGYFIVEAHPHEEQNKLSPFLHSIGEAGQSRVVEMIDGEAYVKRLVESIYKDEQNDELLPELTEEEAEEIQRFDESTLGDVIRGTGSSLGLKRIARQSA